MNAQSAVSPQRLLLQLEFNIDLQENPPGGSTVVVVSASDLDLGDYGVVRYSLKDPLNRFTIDAVTVGGATTSWGFYFL